MKRFKHIVRRVCATYIGAVLASPVFVVVFAFVCVLALIEGLFKGILRGLCAVYDSLSREFHCCFEVAAIVCNPITLRKMALEALNDEQEAAE